MIQPWIERLLHRLRKESNEFKYFCSFIFFYSKKHVLATSHSFEKYKNKLVKLFLMKRGRYNRPFLHITTMIVLTIGVLVTPYLTDTFPIFSDNPTKVLGVTSTSEEQSITVGDDVFQTQISQKPRDAAITYTVERGDTLSTIAQKYQISEDTIRWANNLTDDNLTVGDTLKILPVTGVEYKVQSGDTVYSIAKKYNTDAQGIVDFPFNTFADNETFALVVGELLIVPNGSITPVASSSNAAPFFQAYTGPIEVASGGYFFPLPNTTGISQYFSWYHNGLDITDPIGTPIYAAHSGTVSIVHVGTYDTGYGNNIYIDDGDGISTHYAHMESVNVSVGEQAIGGQTIVGWVGLTGRTTGPHCHFEVRRNGVPVDPVPYVGTR